MTILIFEWPLFISSCRYWLPSFTIIIDWSLKWIWYDGMVWFGENTTTTTVLICFIFIWAIKVITNYWFLTIGIITISSQLSIAIDIHLTMLCFIFLVADKLLLVFAASNSTDIRCQLPHLAHLLVAAPSVRFLRQVRALVPNGAGDFDLELQEETDDVVMAADEHDVCVLCAVTSATAHPSKKGSLVIFVKRGKCQFCHTAHMVCFGERTWRELCLQLWHAFPAGFKF